MSNLIQNTTNLQNILTTINDLPEAGGSGGDIETCTMEINYYEVDESSLQMATQVSYINGENKVITTTLNDWTVVEEGWNMFDVYISITVTKGTFICTPFGSSIISGDAEPLDNYGFAILVNGDAALASI